MSMMEKPIETRPNTLVKQFSYDWGAQELPESPSPSEEPPDLEQDEPDVESKERRMELTRTQSGPPYTIFSARAKMFIVISVSVSSLISPFGATTFYPALNTLARELNVTPTLINLSLTTYMVCIRVIMIWFARTEI